MQGFGKGIFDDVELAAINTGAAENAFPVFHVIGLYHPFNRQAHGAVLSAGMTMVAFFRIRFELK